MGFYCYEIVGKLFNGGLEHLRDFAFADALKGVEQGCDWLESEGELFGPKKYWRAGTQPGDAVEPIFW